MDRPEIEGWYDQNRARYQDLIIALERLLTTLLKEASIPYHSVSGRLKDKRSFLGKWDRKAYTAPEQIMDVAGLRIITHTTEEVKRVCDVIEHEFAIDDKNSGDKGKNRDVDKVGYLSVHFIAKIDSKRLELSEYKRFEGICFEIQVRSLLQHAWAEIEHDRSYKFAGVLPQEIQRKFYLVAGTLELMDQEFTALSREIDSYAREVRKKTEKGKLDIPVDSTSLLQFLEEYFKGYDLEALSANYLEDSSEIITELSDFGVKNLRDVDMLLNQKTTAEWTAEAHTNYFGILRDAMIVTDARKYFESSWKGHWSGIRSDTIERWNSLGVDTKHLEQLLEFKPLSPNVILIQKRDPSRSSESAPQTDTE